MSEGWILVLQLASPIFAAALVALLGLFVYRAQKRADRDEKLHDEKRTVYRDFIVSLVDAANSITHHVGPDEEALMAFDEESLSKAKLQLALVRLYSPEKIFDLGMEAIVYFNKNDGKPFDEVTGATTTIYDISKVMKEDLRKGLNSKV